jgi:ligand-binding sensor domain-containing protein/AraC-like DNA-binding protein
MFQLMGENHSMYMEKVSVQEGLFSNRIFKTYRDNAGYLWIAGVNGVAKYDGFYVVNYSSQSDSLDQFIDGSKFSEIIQDKYNHIWVGGKNGLHKLDDSNNTFKQIAPKDIRSVSSLRLINDTVLGVSCVNKRNFYINCATNLVVKTNEVSYITSVDYDSDGIAWESTFEGYVIYNDIDTVLDIKKPIHDLCLTPNRDLYLATTTGLVYVPHSEIGKNNKHLISITETSENLSITNNSVTAVEYSNAYVWVGTRRGLNQITLDKDGHPSEILHFHNQPNNPFSLVNNQINDIYTDNEGIIWVSTYGGLNKIDLQHLWFYSFRNNPEDANSLHDNAIFPIEGDALGHVWLGSYDNGVSRYSVKNKQFTRFNSADGSTIKRVSYIYTDKKNITWLSADSKLFQAGDKSLSRAEILKKDGQVYPFSNIYSISQHSNGSYWMGIDRYLVELRRVSSKTFQIIQKIELRASVLSIFVDNYQRVWAGTNGKGLFMIDGEKNDSIISYSPITHSVLKSDVIQEINQDSDGNVWLGSVNGLYRITNDSTFHYAPEKISFTPFFKEDGLTDNYISGILPADNGILWLSSWKGIMKYDPRSIEMCQFTPYTFSDGLVDEKYNRNGVYLDKETNTYYFGSPNGVNYFNPLKDVKTKALPQVLVHQIGINGDLEPLKLSPKREDLNPEIIAKIQKKGRIDELKVQFSSSSLLSTSKQIFAWQLEGKDEAWTFTRNRELIIHDISSGKYSLKIRAASQSGQLGEPVQILIEVDSYIHLALKIIFFLVVIGGVGFWFYNRRKRKMAERKKEKRYVFSKLTDDKLTNAASHLVDIMTTDKPFLHPDLNANKLAKLIGVSEVELSQILNEYLNTKFYEYINKCRVEEFIRLLQTPDAEKFTIKGLSEKCGFTSKSTFYRAFNIEKGMTPAQFAKDLKKKSK